MTLKMNFLNKINFNEIDCDAEQTKQTIKECLSDIKFAMENGLLPEIMYKNIYAYIDKDKLIIQIVKDKKLQKKIVVDKKEVFV